MRFDQQPIAADQRKRDELVDAFKAVLATGHGKIVLFWVLEQAAIYRDAYSGDDAATNYTLGQQSIGRKLIQMLDGIDPRAYPTLLLEVADMRVMADAAAKVEKEDDDDAV